MVNLPSLCFAVNCMVLGAKVRPDIVLPNHNDNKLDDDDGDNAGNNEDKLDGDNGDNDDDNGDKLDGECHYDS